ncbi:MAG: SurA N-terminal domain-containing protein [Candidatus Sedimenticola sp. (ex Thyasira tokunagai)]
MLQSIRESAQGVIAWVIVVLISVPFALWGIQEYLGVSSDPVMASVNGQEITEKAFDRGYREFRQNLRERLGKNYRPELIDETVLRKEVLDAMIRNSLIMQATDQLNLRAGDEQVRGTIRRMQNFQAGGVFNQAAYERGVSMQGLTQAGFEAQVRSGLVSEQLPRAISVSEFVTSAEVNELVRLSQQKRAVDYLIVPSARFTDTIAVNESDTQSYYDAHHDEFMAPERVKVLYLELDLENIASTLEADEEAMLEYYDQHKSDYITEEQRSARHILIAVDATNDEAAESSARALADTTLARINGGEDFSAVAKELSQDPGTSDMGGDLGYFGKGEMDDAFDAAAFAMNEGAISEPVRTEFGFHIIQLTGIRPKQGKSFDDARDEVKVAHLKDQAERLFYEYAEKMNDLAYEDPDSLEPAAAVLNLEVSESGWFTRDGGEGIASSLKVASAAFSDDVLSGGHNSEAIELGAEHMVVLRILEHEESALKELADVSVEITTKLKMDGAGEKAREQADILVAQLKAGAAIDTLAQDNGLLLEQKGLVERDSRDLPAGLVSHLFVMPRPEEGKASFGQAQLAGGNVAVIALKQVNDGTAGDLAQIGGEAAARSALQRSLGRNYFQQMVGNLRAAADIQMVKKEE